jgi:hypothetical protein
MKLYAIVFLAVASAIQAQYDGYGNGYDTGNGDNGYAYDNMSSF